MPIPKDFFTLQSMATLTGATGITFVVCNGLQRALNFNPRWLGLAVAIIVVLVGVYASGGRTPVDYFVGVINGFLVFCTTVGATGAAASAVPAPKGDLTPAAGGMRGFLTPWF